MSLQSSTSAVYDLPRLIAAGVVRYGLILALVAVSAIFSAATRRF